MMPPPSLTPIDFAMRTPLIQGQGNFGSVDGDPPAAMRYTEARMTQAAADMLDDLEKDTGVMQAPVSGFVGAVAALAKKREQEEGATA